MCIKIRGKLVDIVAAKSELVGTEQYGCGRVAGKGRDKLRKNCHGKCTVKLLRREKFFCRGKLLRCCIVARVRVEGAGPPGSWTRKRWMSGS
jgi:hypothetical protein